MKLPQNIANRIRVIAIDTLLQYESVEDTIVKNILVDIENSSQLKTPLIVDTTHKLLIDGHHRVQAIKALGALYVPVLEVDYFCPDVSMSHFFYFIDARGKDQLVDIMAKSVVRSTYNKSTMVLAAIDCSQKSLTIQFDCGTHDIISHFKKTVETELIQTEESICFGARDNPRWDHIVYFEPLVSKKDILEMAKSKLVFSSHINKHFVRDRITSLNIPIQWLFEQENKFSTLLNDHVNRSTFRVEHNTFKAPGKMFAETHWIINEPS